MHFVKDIIIITFSQKNTAEDPDTTTLRQKSTFSYFPKTQDFISFLKWQNTLLFSLCNKKGKRE